MFPHPREGSARRPIFDTDALLRMHVSEGLIGEAEEIEEYPTRKLCFISREGGPLALWAQPTRGREYIIGAYHPVIEASDWAVGCVLDQRTGDQVAQLREPMPALKFAERLALTARFYNWAFLLPQTDDSAFARALLGTPYPIERIYTGSGSPGAPLLGISASLGIGVEITDATWPHLVSAFADSVHGNRNPITLRSRIARDECLNFTTQPNGKPGVKSGSDACVWAAALASFGLAVAPRQESHARQIKSQHRWGTSTERASESGLQ